MTYAILYISILLPLWVADAVWLSATGGPLYKATLGDIMLASPKIAPAVVFYLIYPAGLLIFAGLPAMKAGSVMPGVVYGALLGFFAYGAYDLTNLATLRNWTLQLTIIDMAWGTLLSGFASAVGYYAATAINGWIGRGI
jgi:uncharacterized membrane protein